MNITKDEASILSTALNEIMYEFTERISDSKEEANKNIQAFTNLSDRLDRFSNDGRRTGRKSLNSFTDVLKRFCRKELSR